METPSGNHKTLQMEWKAYIMYAQKNRIDRIVENAEILTVVRYGQQYLRSVNIKEKK